MKLSTKISLTVTAVILVTATISLVALLSAREVTTLMGRVVTDNVPSLRAAEELEIALLNQRGFLSAYMLDGGNKVWLEELEARKPALPRWLARARATAHTASERQILDQLEGAYRDYDRLRDRVLALYAAGDTRSASSLLLDDMAALHDRAYRLCEDLIAANERYIARSTERSRMEMARVTVRVSALSGAAVALGLLLLWFFFHGVLKPLRLMAEEFDAYSADDRSRERASTPQDELRKVGSYLKSLMSDVREARSRLERSRMQLIDAEKLASLGKLAASVGHEIRNPLTSIKMRVYSIRRALGENPEYEDDLLVIADEIARLESILRSFLDFSRPPELNVRVHEMPRLLDKSIELCRHWFIEKDVRLAREDAPELPPVLVDAEQLKQVFLNLIKNAVEAVADGGSVCISTKTGEGPASRPMVVVRVRDDGPGIAPEARERILEPFFTTKEHGTGLGLCIAASILARHNGWLEVERCEEPGACFAVWIPAYEGDNGQDPDRG